MNIVYVANSRFPSEKAQSDQVMAMCRSFAALGSEVTLLVPDRKPVQADDPFLYYAVKPTFIFRRLWCLDALRIKWLGRVGLWIQTATFLLSLRKELRRLRPDVVFSRELYVFAIPGLPGRHVWESHTPHRSPLAKYLMRRLDGIVTLTAASKRRLIGMGAREDRVLVEPDAVDPSLFSGDEDRARVRRELDIPENAFVCLYTGKFTTMGVPKGLDEAIEAVSGLLREGGPIILLAVGGTPQELERYAGRANSHIRFMGHQPQATLGRFYAAADLLLMPFPRTEHYAHYMSPLKLFEYLMSGVPMVVTDLPSVREIVDESSAFVAEPGDPASLMREIRLAMDRPEEAMRRAREAKRLSVQYTWDKRAERITNFIFS